MNKNKDYGDKVPVNSIQDRHAFGRELWFMFEPGWQDYFWQRRGHVQKRCEELGWKPAYWAGSHVKEGNNFQLAYLPINVKLWNTRLLPVQQFLSNIRSSLIPFPSWLLSRSQTYFQLRRRSKPYWKLHLEQFTLILWTEETLILISEGISILVCSQNPWDYHSQPCVEHAKFEISERSSLLLVWYAKDESKISNKLASPKIFHLLSLWLRMFYQAFVHTTKIKGRTVQWWLWVALCNNLPPVIANRVNKEKLFEYQSIFSEYCTQNAYKVVSWEDSSCHLGPEGRDFSNL